MLNADVGLCRLDVFFNTDFIFAGIYIYILTLLF